MVRSGTSLRHKRCRLPLRCCSPSYPFVLPAVTESKRCFHGAFDDAESDEIVLYGKVCLIRPSELRCFLKQPQGTIRTKANVHFLPAQFMRYFLGAFSRCAIASVGIFIRWDLACCACVADRLTIVTSARSRVRAL